MGKVSREVLRAGRGLAAWLNFTRDMDGVLRKRALELAKARERVEAVVLVSKREDRYSPSDQLRVLQHVLKVIRGSYKVLAGTPPTIIQDTGTFGDETFPVTRLMALVRGHRLGQLKRCQCGRWFFARNRNQVSCSGKCRLTAYGAKKAVRERRRKYMCEYMQKRRKEERQGLSAKQRRISDDTRRSLGR